MTRLDALTGGDDFGAGCLGVSTGFFLGNRILGRGAFGVSGSSGTVTCSANTLDEIAGAGIQGGVGTTFTAFAGVLGSVTSDETTAGSGSEEMVIALAGREMAAWGTRAVLASAVLAHNGTRLSGEDSSPWIGLEALHPVWR